MKGRRSPIPIVDYSALEYEVDAQIFDGLCVDGAVMIKNLPAIHSSSTQRICEAFSDFVQRPAVETDLFKAKDSTIPEGYSPYGSFALGSRSSNRLFMRFTNEGKVATPLPAFSNQKYNLTQSVEEFFPCVQQLILRAVYSLERGFNLPPNTIMNQLSDHQFTMAVEDYVPTTQEKIQYRLEHDLMSVTENGDPEAFIPHHDLGTFSALTYQENKIDGLEIETTDPSGKVLYKKLIIDEPNPYQLQVLLLAGETLEFLTAGRIHAPFHRVVLDPLQSGQTFSRRAANLFFIERDFKSSRKYTPVLSVDGNPCKPITVEKFYDEHYKLYVHTDRSRIAKTLPPEVISRFPHEAELVQEHTAEDSMRWRRK